MQMRIFVLILILIFWGFWEILFFLFFLQNNIFGKKELMHYIVFANLLILPSLHQFAVSNSRFLLYYLVLVMIVVV